VKNLLSNKLSLCVLLLALVLPIASFPGKGYAYYGVTFYKGDKVQVRNTGGAGLRVRVGPGLRYDKLTTMQEGQVVTVVAGPIWSDGYGWYKVTGYDSAGNAGWAAGWWLYRVSRADNTPPAQVAQVRVQEYSEESAASDSSSTTNTKVAVSRPSESNSGSTQVSSSGRTYRVLTSGFNGAEFGSTGYMANGRRVHWGAVAVDPRYIPLGTRMYISGFGNQVFVAEDTGGAIKGWRIDIWFPSVAQARQYGMQWRTITIIP